VLVTEITILSVEAVDWPDASLGCPQPDKGYAQVITPGYRLVLGVKGETYEVHTDADQTVLWCEEKKSAMKVPPTPDTEPDLAKFADLVREDLAKRLSIPVAEIRVLEARQVVWPDASLGCPLPGMAYAQVLQDGLLIRLGVGEQMYFYHSGSDRDPFLCEDSSLMVPRGTPKYDELLPPPGSETD
jgi:hypothetical protein